MLSLACLSRLEYCNTPTFRVHLYVTKKMECCEHSPWCSTECAIVAAQNLYNCLPLKIRLLEILLSSPSFSSNFFSSFHLRQTMTLERSGTPITIYFNCNIRMGQLSWSVCHYQAFPILCNVTQHSSLLGPLISYKENTSYKKIKCCEYVSWDSIHINSF